MRTLSRGPKYPQTLTVDPSEGCASVRGAGVLGCALKIFTPTQEMRCIPIRGVFQQLRLQQMRAGNEQRVDAKGGEQPESECLADGTKSHPEVIDGDGCTLEYPTRNGEQGNGE